MKNTVEVSVRFEPETLGLATVEVARRTWLPFSPSQSGAAIDPACWQTRAARGISWHRAGRAPKRQWRQ